MSNGLITLAANGSTTVTISRPGGQIMDVPIEVADSSSLSGLQYAGEDFTNYTDTDDLLAQVSSIIGGTGDYHTCIYDDGRLGSGPCLSIDETVLYKGHHTMKYLFDPTLDHPGLSPSFAKWGATTTLDDFWARFRIRFTPGFTTTGTNTMASGAYKVLGWIYAGCDGSGRIEFTGMYNDENPATEIYSSAKVSNTMTTIFEIDNGIAGGHIVDEFTDGEWYDYIIHHETPTSTTRTLTWWHSLDGDTPIKRESRSGTCEPGYTMPSPYAICLGLNVNQPIANVMSLNYGAWEVVDGSVHSNPYGLSDA